MTFLILCLLIRVPDAESQEIEYFGSAVFGGPFTAAQIEGSYAYCSAEGGLMILDISDPENIIPIGGTPFIYNGWDLSVSENHAYVTAYMEHLSFAIVDISDPHNPIILSTLDSTGYGPIAYLSNHVYVVDRYEGLRIIDVSDPHNPRIVGAYLDDYEHWDIAVSGSYAYLALAEDGLEILDITDPLDPSLVSHYDSPIDNFAACVFISDTYAYIGGWFLEIVDISVPSEPVYTGHYEPAFGIWDICVDGDYLYGIGGTDIGDHQFVIVNVEDPNNPYGVGEYFTGWFTDISNVEHQVYISGRSEALTIIDVSVPVSPDFLGAYEVYGGLSAIAVSQNYAYAATNVRGSFFTIDVSDYSSPVVRQINNISGNVFEVDIEDNYLYVSSGNIQIYDISETDSPVFAGEYMGPSQIYGVDVQGQYAYVTPVWDGLQIVDISDPGNPFLVGECPLVGPFQVFVRENLAFVTEREPGLGLAIVDVSNSVNPVLIGRCETPLYARRLYIEGEYAYVTVETYGIEIIDISDPYHPVAVSNYHTRDATGDVFVQDNYAFVTAGDEGLLILDVSDPLTPVLITTYNNGTRAATCHVIDDYIFLGCSYSMIILRFDTESGVVEEIAQLPDEYFLYQNFPNPFNPTTTISYSIPEQSDIRIEVYNIIGQRVATLLDGNKQAGNHSIVWQADNHPSGVYFARLEAGGRSETVKIELLR